MLIYLLPGFLGLWVFKNMVQEDIDRRGESTQIAIALLLWWWLWRLHDIFRRNVILRYSR